MLTVPLCGSCRQLESYRTTSELACTPLRLIAGVEREALNLASALSSYSSESPTATTPVPLVNSARAWPAVAFHDTGSRKVHPSNSTATSPPAVGPWSSPLACTQPSGAVAVQSVPSPPDSLSETNGPSSRLSKFSAKIGCSSPVISMLSMAHHQLLWPW